MGFENKWARFMRNSGPARFFIPVGVTLIVVGILLLCFQPKDYEETVAKVTDVVACERIDTESPQEYDVSFTYLVAGKTYTGLFTLTGEYKTGEELTVYYDPAAPERVSNTKSAGLFAAVLIGLGAVALVFGVYKTVTLVKKARALDAAAPDGFPSEAFVGFKGAPSVTEYYVRYDGNMLHPGYLVEDGARNLLYEGKMDKNALVGARHFSFHNHVTGAVAEHEVGHTVSSGLSDEYFSISSRFKFDGENIWDLLHGKGLRMITDMHSILPRVAYEVAKNGAPFARIETCSQYVHEEDEAQHKIAIQSGKMFYRVWSNTDDLDLLFLTVFAISETDQAVVE